MYVIYYITGLVIFVIIVILLTDISFQYTFVQIHKHTLIASTAAYVCVVPLQEIAMCRYCSRAIIYLHYITLLSLHIYNKCIIYSPIFEHLMRMTHSLYPETCVTDSELLETFLQQENWRHDRKEIVEEILSDRQTASEGMELMQKIALQNRMRLEEATTKENKRTPCDDLAFNRKCNYEPSYEPICPKPSYSRPNMKKLERNGCLSRIYI
jgi:hypothetical protein